MLDDELLNYLLFIIIINDTDYKSKIYTIPIFF